MALLLMKEDLLQIITQAPMFCTGNISYLDISSNPVTPEALAACQHNQVSACLDFPLSLPFPSKLLLNSSIGRLKMSKS